MRAMGSPAAGAVERLGLVELAEPRPQRGEVVVRVVAAAVNPADIKVQRGDFAGRVLHARTKPLVTGYDLSGVVEACGAGVDDLAVGDEVFGFLPYASNNDRGSFAERVAISREHVARKPSGVGHDVAAAAATPGLSALQAMRDEGGLGAGGKVLVIGAAGGVGTLAIGIAKALGATVTGVCSTPAVELVRELGADEVVDRRTTDPYTLAGPFDVIFDTSAQYSYTRMRRALAPGGAFVTTLPSLAWLGGKLRAVFAGTRCRVLVVHAKRGDLDQLATWLGGGLRVPIHARFPIRDLSRAFERYNQGDARGRIVVDVDGGW